MVVVDLLVGTVAVAALWLGADQFVTGASRTARRLGISGLVVGLTVVAFGTSAPEFAVTLDAAVQGRADISVANVVGSNVLNLGFILGGVATLQALRATDALVRRDGLVMVGTTLLALALLLDRTLTRPEGGLLAALLLAYLLYLARAEGDRATVEMTSFHWPDLVRLAGGLALVVAGGHLLVEAATALARAAGVSEWLIGVTVVAAGTSLPEFATSVAAVNKGRTGISAGNIVGSCVFNVLGVLGAAALVRPLSVGPAAVETTAWLLGTTVLVTVLFYTETVLTRLEGLLLVLLNAANWLLELL